MATLGPTVCDEGAHLRGARFFVLFSLTFTTGGALPAMMNGGGNGTETL